MFHSIEIMSYISLLLLGKEIYFCILHFQGELLTIYAAIPHAEKSGIFSYPLPNKLNVSFHYNSYLIIVMLSYIPGRLIRLSLNAHVICCICHRNQTTLVHFTEYFYYETIFCIFEGRFDQVSKDHKSVPYSLQ